MEIFFEIPVLFEELSKGALEYLENLVENSREDSLRDFLTIALDRSGGKDNLMGVIL